MALESVSESVLFTSVERRIQASDENVLLAMNQVDVVGL
jgi:hypothetical protein